MNSFALSHLEMEVRVPIFGTGTVVNRWNWNSNLHHFGLYRFKTLDKQQIRTHQYLLNSKLDHVCSIVFGVGLLQWLQLSFYGAIWHFKLPNSVIEIRNYSREAQKHGILGTLIK